MAFAFIRSKQTCTFESMFEDPELLAISNATIKHFVMGQYGLESWMVTSKKNESNAKSDLKNIMQKYGIVNE